MHLVPVFYPEGDRIMSEGEVGREMYIVVSGTVQLRMGSMSLGYLERGRCELRARAPPPPVAPAADRACAALSCSFFGEAELVGRGGGRHGDVRQYSTVAALDADVAMLTKEMLDKISTSHPEVTLQLPLACESHVGHHI